MRHVVLAVILLALGHGAASAKCKRTGKVLYRETQRPLRDATVDGKAETVDFKIYATGAWTLRVEGREPVSRRGCLSRDHRKALERAVAKAKFALDTTGLGTCKAVSTTEVVYASPKRKKTVTIASPCGTPVEEWTGTLVRCAQLAVAPEDRAPSTILMLCRGAPEYEEAEPEDTDL